MANNLTEELILDAYERIVENAKEGKGVRLSAEEVKALAEYDPAVYNAVKYRDVEPGERVGP